MTFPEQDEPYQYGSTVLPGVPLPASAHPHPPVAPPPDAPAPAVAPPSAAPPGEPAAPAPAPAKAPWWKKQVGGPKKAADPVAAAEAAGDDDSPVPPPPVAQPPVAPAPPPASAPRVDLAPPVAEPLTPTADLAPPSVDPPPAETEPAALPPRGRHAASAPPPTPARGGSRLLVLAVIGLVVVLAAVAAFVWPGFLTSSDGGAAAVSPTASPSPSALAVSLSTPDKIDGMRRFTGAADKALDASVAKVPVTGLTDPVSAVYGTGTTPQVQVIAWKAVSPPASDTVTAGFTGFEGSTGAKVTAVREVEVPGLGGHMECGLATVEKTKTLQCFWADDASFGAVTVLAVSDRAKATSTATTVRAAVEQTG